MKKTTFCFPCTFKGTAEKQLQTFEKSGQKVAGEERAGFEKASNWLLYTNASLKYTKSPPQYKYNKRHVFPSSRHYPVLTSRLRMAGKVPPLHVVPCCAMLSTFGGNFPNLISLFWTHCQPLRIVWTLYHFHRSRHFHRSLPPCQRLALTVSKVLV